MISAQNKLTNTSTCNLVSLKPNIAVDNFFFYITTYTNFKIFLNHWDGWKEYNVIEQSVWIEVSVEIDSFKLLELLQTNTFLRLLRVHFFFFFLNSHVTTSSPSCT